MIYIRSHRGHCGSWLLGDSESLWITVETVSHAVCDDVDLDDLDDLDDRVILKVTLELIGSGNSLLESLKRCFQN